MNEKSLPHPSDAPSRPLENPVIQFVQTFARSYGLKPCEAVARVAGFTCYEQYRQARFACEHGTAELWSAMDSKKISISNAAYLARWPGEVQREIVALDKREIVRWVKRLRHAITELEAQS